MCSMDAAAHDGEVTIVIPHYQTPDAIRLCLRSIRRYTASPYRVLVIDNGSTDGSLEYLRSVKWIECISGGAPNDVGAAHAMALNIGADRVETPYFVVMHSDTYVHRGGWLSFLIQQLHAGDYAAVGSRHQTIRAYDSAVLARVIARAAGLIDLVARREVVAGVPWIRSCLALYRTDRFRAAAGRFLTEARRNGPGREDATHPVNKALVAHGYRLLALPDRVLGYYVFHKGDTTRITNALYPPGDAEFLGRIDRHRRHVSGFHARADVQAILRDASLDA
jgi:glycosyltransferase involved in cell wall biosynthesis